MTPIQLDFKPSSLLIIILGSFVISMILVLMIIDLAWLWRLIMIMALVLSAMYAISKDGMMCMPWSVLKLTVNAQQELHLYRKNGQQLLAQVEASSVVTPYLTILHLRTLPTTTHKKTWRNRQAVIVLPDHVDKEDYRQLRVWLRWGDYKTSNQASV